MRSPILWLLCTAVTGFGVGSLVSTDAVPERTSDTREAQSAVVAFFEVREGQPLAGDNLWDVWSFACDFGHDNTFTLQRDGSPVCGSENCPGPPGLPGSPSSCWSNHQKVGGLDGPGSLNVGIRQDDQMYGELYLYVSPATNLSVPYSGGEVGRFWLNGVQVSGNPLPLSLSSGWNHLEFTLYNQHEGASLRILAPLRNLFDESISRAFTVRNEFAAFDESISRAFTVLNLGGRPVEVISRAATVCNASGAEPDECPGCGDDVCEPPENVCGCAADCGPPPSTESDCADGLDNDCDTLADCEDPDCCIDSTCRQQNPECHCSDGVCEEPGEDACSCPDDCPQGCGQGTVRATRVLPDGYLAGIEFEVCIDLSIPAETRGLALEDRPPPGSVTGSMSAGCFWDAATGKVKCGPYGALIPVRLCYRVTIPGDEDGEPVFVGIVSLDGNNEPICGDACLTRRVCPPLRADQAHFCNLDGDAVRDCGDCSTCATCEDREIRTCEISGYACAWAGCHEDQAGLTRAAYVWKRGESYCWSESQHDWFPIPAPPPQSGCCDASTVALYSGDGILERPTHAVSLAESAASRLLPNGYCLDEATLVCIALDVPAGTTAITVEDRPPDGWALLETNPRGTWDPVYGKVKWGPFYFDGPFPTALCYTVAPVDAAGTYCFSGTISLDGFNNQTGGGACIPPERATFYDFAGFQNCLTAKDGSVQNCCQGYDFQGDGRVDLDDFSAFLGRLTGP